MKARKIKQLIAVMTPFPHTLDIEDSLEDAQVMMKKYKIRHLPVSQKGKLLGLLSDRDMHWALRPELELGTAKDIKVGRFCLREVYSADVSTPLDQALVEMAGRHIGSTLVTKDEKLVGIFTTSDVCRHFAEHLRSEFPDPQGEPEHA